MEKDEKEKKIPKRGRAGTGVYMLYLFLEFCDTLCTL